MTGERRFLFLIHRALENRAGRRLRAALRQAPSIAGRARTVTVADLGQAADLIGNLDRDTVPVAAGGDGTVNLLVQALRMAEAGERPIGVLPLGTGNAFAHEVGAATLERGLELLLTGRPVARDIMLTTNPAVPLALLSLSTGIEDRAIRVLERRRRWVRPMRLLAGGIAGLTAPRTRAKLVVDGRVLTEGEPVVNAGLYNTRRYGFGRVVFPGADPADGMAEAVVWNRLSDYWRALVRGVRQEREDLGIRMAPWRAATLVAARAVQVDGEPGPGGTFEVRVAQRGLLVLAG